MAHTSAPTVGPTLATLLQGLPPRMQSYLIGLTAADALSIFRALWSAAAQEPLPHRRKRLRDAALDYLDLARAQAADGDLT